MIHMRSSIRSYGKSKVKSHLSLKPAACSDMSTASRPTATDEKRLWGRSRYCWCLVRALLGCGPVIPVRIFACLALLSHLHIFLAISSLKKIVQSK